MFGRRLVPERDAVSSRGTPGKLVEINTFEFELVVAVTNSFS
jgi:hypothetical protein